MPEGYKPAAARKPTATKLTALQTPELARLQGLGRATRLHQVKRHLRDAARAGTRVGVRVSNRTAEAAAAAGAGAKLKQKRRRDRRE